MTDVSIDTLLLIDGARTGGVIALDRAEAVAAKLGNVARSARVVVQSAHASAGAVSTEVRNVAAAMADGADAFLARLRAGGMQMSTASGGGGSGPNLGGLSAETLAEAAQAAKEAFKDKRLGQQAPKHGQSRAPHADAGGRPSDPAQPSNTRDHLATQIKNRVLAAGGDFALRYTDVELDAIIARGHQLQLPEK